MPDFKNTLLFVDTNIFLRVLVKEDEKTFRECSQFLKKIDEGKYEAVTSGVVFMEIAFTLRSFYKFDKLKVIEALEGILSLSNLKIIDGFDIILALGLYENHHVKFVDCLIASSIIKTGKKAVMVSYDSDFDELKIPRIAPRVAL